MKRFLVPLLLLALVPACASPTGGRLKVASAGVTAYAPLAISSALDRWLLAVVVEWKSTDIDHVKLEVFRGAEATAIDSLDVPKARLADTIAIENLARTTTYTILAHAYSGADEATTAIDNIVADKPSCETTFTTAANDSITLTGIKLKLKAKTFSGTTVPKSLDILPGGITDTGPTEAVVVN